MPSTAARLTAAWPQTSVVTPAASRFPNGSRHESATRKPAQAKSAKPVTTTTEPTSPSSSPTTAKIMSVWASGRKLIFWIPCPIPSPVSPPEPMPMIACTFWNPAPSASFQGSRKLNTRSRR